jgi:hypothetical protein
MAQVRKQNVTVSLSVQTIRQAKLLAAKRSTSISGPACRANRGMVGAVT